MITTAAVPLRMEEMEKRAINLPDSFEGCFDKNHGTILNYCIRRLGSMAEAEDVTAETFTRAFKSFRKLQRSSQEQQSWLYRTATNLIYDSYRKRKRRKEQSYELIGRTEIEESVSVDNVDEDPQTRLERWEQWTLVRAQIDRLKPKYQDVLILRFIEEKTIDEIAQIVESRPGTVKWRLHKGLEKLGNMMEKQRIPLSRSAERGLGS